MKSVKIMPCSGCERILPCRRTGDREFCCFECVAVGDGVALVDHVAIDPSLGPEIVTERRQTIASDGGEQQ